MPNFHTFIDRSKELFGRQTDIEYLMNRIQHKGLTIVSGRPQIGKTWLLEQVGWIVESQRAYLVGYHESKGESDDHLLRTVLDLYRRWLSSASVIQQAESIYKRNKHRLVSGVGGLFGTLFKEFIPGGETIEKILKELSEADQDLKSGGIELPSLDYDNALSLTQLVFNESDGRPVILILDAWEKSSSTLKVYNNIEAFLKHSNEWPQCHILIGIRSPELHFTSGAEKAFDLAKDLIRASSLSTHMKLKPMCFEDPAEIVRMISYVRSITPGAAMIKVGELVRLIDGFPGIIKRFRESGEKHKVHDEQRIRELAQDGQVYRYREFEKLLPNLSGEELIMAIRLGVFQRLSEESWPLYRELICEETNPFVWERLRQNGVFESESFPSYGHDTRHEEALRGLKAIWPERVRSELVKIIYGLASHILYIDSRDRHFAAALAGLQDKVKEFNLDEFCYTLCVAAKSLFIDMPSKDLEFIELSLSELSQKCPGATNLLLAVNCWIEKRVAAMIF